MIIDNSQSAIYAECFQAHAKLRTAKENISYFFINFYELQVVSNNAYIRNILLLFQVSMYHKSSNLPL